MALARIGYLPDPPPPLYSARVAGGCSSAWLECRTVTAEVAGSSPVSPAPVIRGCTPSRWTGCCHFQPPSLRWPSPNSSVPRPRAPRAGPRGGGGRRPRGGRDAGRRRPRGGAPPRRARGPRHRPGPRRDRLQPGRASATRGIRYLEAAYDSPEALEAVAGVRARASFCSISGSPPANWMRRAGDLLSDRALHSTCGWRDEGASAADLLNEADGETLERIFAEYGDERRARRLAGEIVRRRRAGPVRRQRRSGERDPRHARPSSRSIRVRPPLPGGADRRERRAGRAGPRPAGVPGRAGAGRRAGRDHLSLGRGPAGQARLPRMGQRLRLSSASAGLHLPRPAAGPGRAAQADRSVRTRRSPRTRGPGAPS